MAIKLTVLCENSIERVTPAGLQQAQRLAARCGRHFFFATVGTEVNI